MLLVSGCVPLGEPAASQEILDSTSDDPPVDGGGDEDGAEDSAGGEPTDEPTDEPTVEAEGEVVIDSGVDELSDGMGVTARTTLWDFLNGQEVEAQVTV
ncbi:hypothetical protein [Nesterenkonia suensis]